MSVQLIPAPLPELKHRRFALDPAIAGIPHNQWVLRRASWTELVVINTQTSHELSIPQRFVGSVFWNDLPAGPAQTLELLHRLEYRGGRVLPLQRSVIELPLPGATHTEPKLMARVERPADWRAPVVAIRAEATPDSRLRRALRGSIAIGFLACMAMVVVLREQNLGAPAVFGPGILRSLPFHATDDYTTVVNRLGHPSTDTWMDNEAGGGFRRLLYPRRRLQVLLSGETRDSAHYIGALGRDGRVIHSVEPLAIRQWLDRSRW